MKICFHQNHIVYVDDIWNDIDQKIICEMQAFDQQITGYEPTAEKHGKGKHQGKEFSAL